LKVGIAGDIPARLRRVLKVALTAYTGRVMYLRGLVAGAPRLDLDGNPAGEVTAGDAEYAAAKLAKILASREAAAVAAKGGERVKPAVIPPSPAPPAAKTLKERPVLRLPAFRQKCG
jgi:ProP effector